MKYWLYSDGNILGPYDPAEMLGLPAFNDDSLVCAETATGDNAEDWKAATQVGELAALIGSGRSVSASVAAGAYRLNAGSGFDSGYGSATEFDLPGESSNAGTGNYGELLDTIDQILGTRKPAPDATKPQPADYELAEKFDIRLSRIQEELEAARWEKNLLLEKMRLKELEERKQKGRIAELEARLKGELGQARLNAAELEQVRHLSELQEKTEAVKRIEEIKREELSLEKYLVAEPQDEAAARAAQPQGPEVKKLKSIAPSDNIGLKRLTGEPEGDAGLPGLPGVSEGRGLRSLGQTQKPAYVYGAKDEEVAPEQKPAPAPAPSGFGSHRDTPLPGPEAAPPGAFKGFDVPSEPLPQQAGGLVYDFTVVAPAPQGSSQHFKIDVPPAPAPFAAPAPAAYAAPAPAAYVAPAPAAYVAPAPAPAPYAAPAPAPAPAPRLDATVRMQAPLEFVSPSQAAIQTPARRPVSEQAALSPAAAGGPASPDKTVRLSTDEMAELQKAAPARPAAAKPLAQDARPKRKSGRMFAMVIVVFGFIAAGGLALFFLGDGLSLSQFTMMNMSGKKRGAAQAEASGPVAVAEPAQPAPVQTAAAQPQPAPQPEPAPAQEPKPAEKPSNENVRKAIEIVKNYKLAGGRGTIETWFANSFLSGGAGGANEEWTATPLHGDILVASYRLIRPKQDPMIYQFEVDAVKGEIVRGINNNAIELLDSGEKAVTAKAEPAPEKKRPAAKPKARKPAKPREIGLLPLPEDDGAGKTKAEPDPTGFETPETDAKVKYLKAQESDEELF